jgi:hypothetical protein
VNVGTFVGKAESLFSIGDEERVSFDSEDCDCLDSARASEADGKLFTTVNVEARCRSDDSPIGIDLAVQTLLHLRGVQP